MRLSLLSEFRVPNKFIRVTNHALKRFKKRVRGGEGVDKLDIVQFIGDSEEPNSHNYRLLRAAYRRRGLKWRGGTIFMIHDIGGGLWIVFVMRPDKADYESAGVPVGAPIMLVRTCWVADYLSTN